MGWPFIFSAVTTLATNVANIALQPARDLFPPNYSPVLNTLSTIILRDIPPLIAIRGISEALSETSNAETDDEYSWWNHALSTTGYTLAAGILLYRYYLHSQQTKIPPSKDPIAITGGLGISAYFLTPSIPRFMVSYVNGSLYITYFLHTLFLAMQHNKHNPPPQLKDVCREESCNFLRWTQGSVRDLTIYLVMKQLFSLSHGITPEAGQIPLSLAEIEYTGRVILSYILPMCQRHQMAYFRQYPWLSFLIGLVHYGLNESILYSLELTGLPRGLYQDLFISPLLILVAGMASHSIKFPEAVSLSTRSWNPFDILTYLSNAVGISLDLLLAGLRKKLPPAIKTMMKNPEPSIWPKYLSLIFHSQITRGLFVTTAPDVLTHPERDVVIGRDYPLVLNNGIHVTTQILAYRQDASLRQKLQNAVNTTTSSVIFFIQNPKASITAILSTATNPSAIYQYGLNALTHLTLRVGTTFPKQTAKVVAVSGAPKIIAELLLFIISNKACMDSVEDLQQWLERELKRIQGTTASEEYTKDPETIRLPSAQSAQILALPAPPEVPDDGMPQPLSSAPLLTSVGSNPHSMFGSSTPVSSDNPYNPTAGAFTAT
jgi:hypothetical protein